MRQWQFNFSNVLTLIPSRFQIVYILFYLKVQSSGLMLRSMYEHRDDMLNNQDTW